MVKLSNGTKFDSKSIDRNGLLIKVFFSKSAMSGILIPQVGIILFVLGLRINIP